MTTTRVRSLCLRRHEVQALLRCGRVLAVRVVKPQPPEGKSIWPCHYSSTGWALGEDPDVVSPSGCHCIPVRRPFDFEGNEMWVKETWTPIGEMRPSGMWTNPKWIGRNAFYDADNDLPTWGGKWRSATQMKQCDSRLTVEVAAVQCKRLHAIAEDEAKAAGFGPDAWASNPWVWIGDLRRVTR